MTWDGNVNSPHTMQDEYELARDLGVTTLTTDDDGQMIAAERKHYEECITLCPIPDDEKCRIGHACWCAEEE